MADTDLRISIGADVTGLVLSVDQARAAVQRLGRLMTQNVQQSASSLTAANAQVTASVQAQQGAQTAAVTGAANAQAQASDQAARRIAENSRRALEPFRQMLDQSVAGFSRGLLQMAEGARSFQQVMLRLGQQILDDFVTRLIDPMIERFIWSEARQTLAHLVGIQQRSAADAAGAATGAAASRSADQQQIAQDAKVAAANAYKSVSAIPLVGPFLAPPAAAAAFAAVEAFSAAGGFDIPAGVNPITQLHAQEMVLPARLANPLRDMLAGFGGGNVGGGGNGGDAHLHYAPTIHAPASASLKQMLVDQGSDMIAFVQAAVRDGALKLA